MNYCRSSPSELFAKQIATKERAGYHHLNMSEMHASNGNIEYNRYKTFFEQSNSSELFKVAQSLNVDPTISHYENCK